MQRTRLTTKPLSNDRFQVIFDCAPDACYLVDLSGRFVDGNGAAEQTIGYQKDELIGSSFLELDLLSPKDLPRAAQLLSQNARGLPTGPDEFTLNRKDGRRLSVEIRTFPVTIDDQRLVLGIARDITERQQAREALEDASRRLEERVTQRTSELEQLNLQLRQEIADRRLAEQALEQREKIYRSAIRSARAAPYQLDFASNRYSFMSDEIEQLTGCPASQFTPAFWPQLVKKAVLRGESAGMTIERAKELFRGGKMSVWQADYQVVRIDGRTVWLSDCAVSIRDDHGNVTGCLGLLQDVSEREQAIQQNSRLGNILEESLNEVYIFDAVSLKFVQVNRGGRANLGYAAEELLEMTPRDVITPDAYDSLCSKLDALREGRLQSASLEIVHCRRDGSRYDAEAHIQPFDWVDRKVFVVFVRDISFHKAAEEKARRLQGELARAWRIASIGEMASTLAHEIHQPLGAIANYAQGCARALETGKFDQDEAIDVARTIADLALRAGAVLRKLRDLIQQGTVEREIVDLNQVLREIVEFVGRAARERDVRIDTRFAEDLPPAKIDRIQIQQVLLNLIQNAFDAMADAAGDDNVVTVSTSYALDGMVTVSVRDTGRGMQPSEMHAAFEPYYTTKSDGIGMGLAISSTIIAAHDGKIWSACNANGRGMTFAFSIPCVAGGIP